MDNFDISVSGSPIRCPARAVGEKIRALSCELFSVESLRQHIGHSGSSEGGFVYPSPPYWSLRILREWFCVPLPSLLVTQAPPRVVLCTPPLLIGHSGSSEGGFVYPSPPYWSLRILQEWFCVPLPSLLVTQDPPRVVLCTPPLLIGHSGSSESPPRFCVHPPLLIGHSGSSEGGFVYPSPPYWSLRILQEWFCVPLPSLLVTQDPPRVVLCTPPLLIGHSGSSESGFVDPPSPPYWSPTPPLSVHRFILGVGG